MEVRRLRLGDESDLKAVRLRALGDTPTAFASSHALEAEKPHHHWAESVRRHADGNEQAIWLVIDEGAPVAMAGAYSPGTDSTERHVFGMWVAPEARRRGVGRQLVDTALAWSWLGGAEFVTLWVVDGNAAAVALYERAGFAPTGISQPHPSHPDQIEWLLRASRPKGK